LPLNNLFADHCGLAGSDKSRRADGLLFAPARDSRKDRAAIGSYSVPFFILIILYHSGLCLVNRNFSIAVPVIYCRIEPLLWHSPLSIPLRQSGGRSTLPLSIPLRLGSAGVLYHIGEKK
jgi:hypothetical protein